MATMLPNGTIPETKRPGFAWNNIQHTNTRGNPKIWGIKRPVPVNINSRDIPVPLNYEVPMGWHHIIPWNVLRDGWSALAGTQRWEVLREWMYLLGVNNSRDRINDIRNNQLQSDPAEDMAQRLCWAKWNLVEGPENRTDDPQERLDTFTLKRGVNNNLRNRMSLLNSMYNHMQTLIKNPTNLTKDQIRNLLQDFKNLKAYKNSQIVMFQAEMWELVSKGKVDKFGLAVNNRHPTWRKRIR